VVWGLVCTSEAGKALIITQAGRAIETRVRAFLLLCCFLL